MTDLLWLNLKIYNDWISQNITPETACENCAFWSLIMKRDFPELILIRGSIYNPYSQDCYHEYLITKSGTIIDPTRIQFDVMFGKNWGYN